jgi:hypothetical protein
MSLGPETDMSRSYVAAVYAEMALGGWSKAFEAEEPSEDLRQPLLSLCRFYGVEAYSFDPLTTIWGELRPELERAALPIQAGRDLHPDEAAAIDTAWAKVRSLPIPVGVRAMPDGTYTSPHIDTDGWPRQICAAFGTRSEGLAQTFIEELKRLATRSGEIDEGKVNAALAIISSVDPQNAVEACLAAQMVALHWLSIESASRALASPRVENVIAAAKVTRAFGEHAQILAKLQGRMKREPQAIHVEKHEHHHHHEHRGTGETESQVHVATARCEETPRVFDGPAPRQLEGCAEVRSEDTGGRVVSLAGRQGEPQVLPPRRRPWHRRAKG